MKKQALKERNGFPSPFLQSNKVMKNEVPQDLQTEVYFIQRTERLHTVRLVT